MTNIVKDMMEEYIELHTSLVKNEYGADSFFLRNGELSNNYKLGLYESKLECILLLNEDERERFEKLNEYLRSKVNHKEKESHND